jgi:mevalonate pyrophosphate decarboxylase
MSHGACTLSGARAHAAPGKARSLLAKYGGTTRTKLEHLARTASPSAVRFTQTDLERLWELVQAAEGTERVINPVHARQRLREALKALREASVAGLP